MHFADSIIIFLLALILFGPKKLPEIARQIGKLMVEFRRASNEFKAQIDDELRLMEQQDRQKKLEAAAAQASVPAVPEIAEVTGSAPEIMGPEETPAPVILPPSSGETVSGGRPYMPTASPELLEAAAAEPHPIYAEALAAENGNPANGIPENGTPATNGSPAPSGSEPENERATVNHG